MRSPNIFYIYVLFDENAVPRYVGKGKGGRINSTIKPNSNNLMKSAFLRRTLSALGSIPAIKIRENLSKSEASEIEIALIAAIGRRASHDGPLTNISIGGDGMTSEEAKALAASFSPEKRAQINKAISASHLKHPPEERRRRALQRQNDLGPEKRKSSGRKGAATRIASSTPEERRDSALRAATSVRKILWINNGIQSRRTELEKPIPAGWVSGRIMLPEIVAALKISTSNSRWINDGIKSRRLKPDESMPEGWSYGRRLNIASSKTSQDDLVIA